MSDIAIKVENLSKKYIIGKTHSGSLRETITGVFHKSDKSDSEEFWALRDVSFDVQRGEAIGIIGKNGAGKSTLLKILSRITEPSRGRIEINGRVSSLLEVGTGFHPELTGRENVFLNGTILGMKRQEIKEKFDEIVEFSGVEKFLDTPVKRFSSGMKVRLAFAVAAHLEPEILIIDEVLAVGDAEFQKKCLNKMEDVTGQGKTVLFVSHQLGSVQNLCTKGVMLSQGQVVITGGIQEVIDEYMSTMQGGEAQDIRDRKDRNGTGRVQVDSIKIIATEKNNNTIKTGDDVKVEITTNEYVPGLNCIFTLYDSRLNRIAIFDSNTISELDSESGNKNVFSCKIDNLYLTPGTYHINVALKIGQEYQDHVESALTFKVDEGILNKRPLVSVQNQAMLVFPHTWQKPGV